MKEGLLWYDDDPKRDFAEKVAQAARRYRKRFGVSPTVCYVHPSAMSGDSTGQEVGKLHIAPLSTVLLHHFWIGVEEKDDETE